MDRELSESERVELRSRRQQDEAFVAALMREIRLGHEHTAAYPAPAASTIRSDAQTLRDAMAAGDDVRESGKWSET